MKNRRHSLKRDKVLTTLKHQHGALSAADLHKKLPELDLTTIYRNLEVFVEDGLVKKLDLGRGESLYEYTKEPHHHAICDDCGEIIHFDLPEEDVRKLVNIKGFEIDSVEVTLHGKHKHKK